MVTLEEIGATFEKICTPAYADVGQEITITYKFTLNSSTPIDKLVVYDDIVKKTSYLTLASTDNIEGTIDTVNGKFNVNTGFGIGTTQTAFIKYRVKALPAAQDEFFTTATAKFSSGVISLDKTAACGVYVGNGKLTMNKLADREYASVGEMVTYTITIQNTGNLASTIPVNGFNDRPDLGYVGNVTIISPSPSQIVFANNLITNNTALVIGAGETVIVKYTATIK